jgi:hypothetical protein
MIARKRLHIIVLALCLWLPLQAIAGQWLHCAQIESNFAQLESATTPKIKPSCHNSIPDSQSIDLEHLDHKKTLTETKSKSCNHCQFSCSWHSAVVLREFIQPGIDTSIVYTQFKLPSPAQPALATPQRPPQLHS